MLQLTQTLHGSADVFESWCAFRHDSGNGFVVTSDDHLFAAGDSVQQLAESRFGIKCGDRGHRILQN
ncbi:MAG: hypothetical protein A3H97_18865 [Acidobacteria bacterium RIFCSPLOWO2_02_FULL_65_29]|nr:MAG: hypothetical protein A3H97_18865 [Acidobacteria bacterium RIFCSPLOWO2_02_FULL_65_29]